MPDISGQSIGRYHIIEKLGEGGMAIVFRALDTHLDVKVAIKMIRTEMFGPAVLGPLLKRFEREAKTLARMQHPNIVHVMDYGEFENVPYLVMEYLPGGTLKSLTGKPMPYPDAARLLVPIARALAYAHEEGIVHRDVKPANILLTKSGIPMLTDFGIAKILESDQSTQLTATGMSIGTPEYMAPEQWSGNVSPKVDIYALGVIFYELVTGRRPYTADTPAALMIKASMDPLPPPKKFAPYLPEDVENVLIKALAKQPENRFANMTEFANILELLAKNGEPGQAQLKVPGLEEAVDIATQISKPGMDVHAVPLPKARTPSPAATPQLKKAARRIPWWVWLAGGLGGLGMIALVTVFALAIVNRIGDKQAVSKVPTTTNTLTAAPVFSVTPTATLTPQSTLTATLLPPPTIAPTLEPTRIETIRPNVYTYSMDATNRLDYTSLWSKTDPKFVDMKSPGTQNYTADIDYTEQYRWGFAWCAVDNDVLQKILAPLTLNFIIDGGQPVSESEISLSHTKSSVGMECQNWDILLGGWNQNTQVKLDISVSLSENINDGIADYQAGQYHMIIYVNPK